MAKSKKKSRKNKGRLSRYLLWGIALPTLWLLLCKVYPRAMHYVAAHKEKHVPTAEYNGRFADMNPVQLEAARRYGVRPIADRTFDFDGCGDLQRIRSCRAYYVDELTHSVPYLIPEAKNLLEDIGMAFQQRLNEDGLARHKVIVTSVLRTEADVTNLQKTNASASSNSAHCYGTTFDIAYTRFRTCGLLEHEAYEDRFVELLAEVLDDMRKQGRCYVRFETKQHCFHITCRKALKS